MNRRALAATMAGGLVVAATLLPVTATASDTASLDALMRLQVGSFSSALQSRYDARYDDITWHIAEIWPGSSDGARWIYTESWMTGAEAPYMQRVARYTEEADGSIVSVRYPVPDAQRFVGAWQEPERLDALDPASLSALPGCETVMSRTGEQRFEGGTTGNRCANSHRGASYAVSRTVLDGATLTNWDRGFDADGALRWGPAAGGYQFRRLDADNTCVDPVRMLVYGNISDREKLVAYARALADSGLYARHGGYYEATTPQLDLFEGDPPAGRGVIIARFPCLAAAQAFWNSPEYTEIRKLREGIAEFEVLVLPTVRYPADLPQVPVTR